MRKHIKWRQNVTLVPPPSWGEQRQGGQGSQLKSQWVGSKHSPGTYDKDNFTYFIFQHELLQRSIQNLWKEMTNSHDLDAVTVLYSKKLFPSGNLVTWYIVAIDYSNGLAQCFTNCGSWPKAQICAQKLLRGVVNYWKLVESSTLMEAYSGLVRLESSFQGLQVRLWGADLSTAS